MFIQKFCIFSFCYFYLVCTCGRNSNTQQLPYFKQVLLIVFIYFGRCKQTTFLAAERRMKAGRWREFPYIMMLGLLRAVSASLSERSIVLRAHSLNSGTKSPPETQRHGSTQKNSNKTCGWPCRYADKAARPRSSGVKDELIRSTGFSQPDATQREQQQCLQQWQQQQWQRQQEKQQQQQ